MAPSRSKSLNTILNARTTRRKKSALNAQHAGAPEGLDRGDEQDLQSTPSLIFNLVDVTEVLHRRHATGHRPGPGRPVRAHTSLPAWLRRLRRASSSFHPAEGTPFFPKTSAWARWMERRARSVASTPRTSRARSPWPSRSSRRIPQRRRIRAGHRVPRRSVPRYGGRHRRRYAGQVGPGNQKMASSWWTRSRSRSRSLPCLQAASAKSNQQERQHQDQAGRRRGPGPEDL